ncbi:MAG: hypothetical protein HUU18_07600 [Phycisphaerales bacterium]|nr:hypothetical protein [Phycisphaerales bacterium]
MKRVACVVLSLLGVGLLAWDAPGHRAITVAALRELPADAPAFLRDAHVQAQIADLATQPDRWRGVALAQLTHINNPDHYLDVEDLEAYALTLDTLPVLRHECIRAMVLAKERAGAAFKGRPVNPATDPAKVLEWPGFLPYAMAENFGKVRSAMQTYRILESFDDPERADQLDAARANMIAAMGILSHFVGDCAQPLHTTTHHHGWIGDNPNAYTTDRGVHAYIDGGVVRLHDLAHADLIAGAIGEIPPVNAKDPWPSLLDAIRRSHALVEPLYVMEKSGELRQEPGRVFILARLADGAATLRALYTAAWNESAPSAKEIADFRRYDGRLDPLNKGE